MRYEEGGFEFENKGDETLVFHKRKPLGSIVTMIEASGRYCFRLGIDRRDEPRTYRGRVRAAEALLCIAELKKIARKKRLSIEEIIVLAWDNKPHSAAT